MEKQSGASNLTAIAILNAFADPHLLADTLISRAEADDRADQTVWLPSLGTIQTALAENNRHIRRLGRKSITLPHGGGMLAYAGEIPRAREFWAEFSERIENLNAYDETRRIDRVMLEAILQSMNVPQLSILGVLNDYNGQQDIFEYGGAVTAETQNYGRCLFAGSGAEFLLDLVLTADAFWSGVNHRPLGQTITEELAESISSRSLFLESAFPPNSQNSPLAHSFGGFVEWYKIERDGVKPHRERVEIHLTSGQRSRIGRVYLVGMVRNQNAPTLGSDIVVVSLTPAVADIEVHQVDGLNLWLINQLKGEGTIIQPSLPFYDRPEEEQAIDRFSGPISYESLCRTFGEDAEFHRVRLVTATGSRIAAEGMVSVGTGDPLAWLGQTDGMAEIVLNHAVASTAIQRLLGSE